MAHVHGAKAVAETGTAKMMDSAMEKMTLGSMMSEGMGSMMKTPAIASGVAVSAGSSAGKSVIKKIITHPLTLFGLGVVAGCYIYKYRKSIISASDETR
ncbi:hypothetical protein V3O24_12655 [Methylobacter sp. Wu8]|uniref:hypothetical protein n=1 Tax=Methylobacter sp. Wu8 TaxID=3118457 RepID=UPI002F304368